MQDLIIIAEVIEKLAIKKFGSVNKMLIENDLSKSVLTNMKRSSPSIPNIKTFSKIAESLDVSVDYLLNGYENSNKIQTQIITKEIPLKLTIDEDMLLSLYRESTEECKKLILDNVRTLWADNRNPKNKLSQSQPENEITVTKQMA